MADQGIWLPWYVLLFITYTYQETNFLNVFDSELSFWTSLSISYFNKLGASKIGIDQSLLCIHSGCPYHPRFLFHGGGGASLPADICHLWSAQALRKTHSLADLPVFSPPISRQELGHWEGGWGGGGAGGGGFAFLGSLNWGALPGSLPLCHYR